MCLGSFETLHLGHYLLIKEAKSLKIQNPNLKTAIIIFKNPIKKGEILNKKAFQLKVRLYTLLNLEFDYIFIIDFNNEIKNIEAKEFIDKLKEINVTNVICGPDFRFGFNKEGNPNLLKKHFSLIVTSEKKINKRKISSTLINELIEEGDIKTINSILIEKYSFIINLNKFNFEYPNNLTRLKSGIYLVNVVIKNYEYHGLCLINKNKNDNCQIYLLDLEIAPSKYEEVFIEFEDLLRNISAEEDNNIYDNDVNEAISYFSRKVK